MNKRPDECCLKKKLERQKVTTDRKSERKKKDETRINGVGVGGLTDDLRFLSRRSPPR